MIGEGEYNINDLKEIMVTESYLGLDQDTRKCQNYEPFYNCTTRQYISTILDQCGCLPHNMVNATKISKVYTSKIFTYPQIKPNQEPLCNNSGIECARKLEVTTSSCFKPCSGFIINGFSKSDMTKSLENVFPVFESYDAYKKITSFPTSDNGKNWFTCKVAKIMIDFSVL